MTRFTKTKLIILAVIAVVLAAAGYFYSIILMKIAEFVFCRKYQKLPRGWISKKSFLYALCFIVILLLFNFPHNAWAAWNIQTVDATNNVGYSTSLALDSSGIPHISYYNSTNDDLKYAEWTGTAWNIQAVDTTGNAGYYTSLALDSSGNPHISYYEYSNGDLKYAKWIGTGWNIQTVDATGNTGYYTSLALDSSGNPHISYHDQTNEDLKYAFFLLPSATPLIVLQQSPMLLANAEP
ncbi:BNR repeat-containing protein [Patescibacteria group bacterium]|nr:BNR repeat-containing protein [Patescibacteria group bacterium]MBU4579661.1 BNR repeat-containing protein [Patescibacteria group bacterium]